LVLSGDIRKEERVSPAKSTNRRFPGLMVRIHPMDEKIFKSMQ